MSLTSVVAPLAGSNRNGSVPVAAVELSVRSRVTISFHLRAKPTGTALGVNPQLGAAVASRDCTVPTSGFGSTASGRSIACRISAPIRYTP